jgi:hypothetical protein
MTMMKMTRNLLTLALLAATAACDGAPTASSALAAPTEGPSLAQSRSRLSFSYTQSGSTETPQTATGGVGQINFTGSITTGTPCYDLTATHGAQGNGITVTVTAASTGGFCTQVITNNNYQGAVTSLAAGSYTFTVIEVVNGQQTTAFTGPIVVQ